MHDLEHSPDWCAILPCCEGFTCVESVTKDVAESVDEIIPVASLCRNVLDNDECFLLCCERLVLRVVLHRRSTSASLLDECNGGLLTGVLYGGVNTQDVM